MRLKKRKEIQVSDYTKKILENIGKYIFNKKLKIFFNILFLMFILLIGIGAGLFFAGFFGSFDNPSPKTVRLIKAIGIDNPMSIKTVLDGILAENIKIPLNIFRGVFSNPKKIYIDIKFEDYQKVMYKREEALKRGVLLATSEDYIPAKINYKGEKVDVKLRLKGDWTDHLEGDKWSFRIKVKGEDTLFGMRTFSIQDPKTRNYLSEFFYQSAFKKEDIIGLRYEFIDVTINGEHKGVYALEEHFDKYLLEDNNRREGIFIKFDEDSYRNYLYQESVYLNAPLPGSERENYYPLAIVDTFKTNSVMEDPIKKAQFERAHNLLQSFRQGSLKTHEVFDVDILARYFAITTILGAQHGASWHNIRFYYNPITSLLEPIGYDGSLKTTKYRSQDLELYFPSCIDSSNNKYNLIENCDISYDNSIDGLFSDSIFFEKYIQELNRVSKKEYLDNLFLELEDSLQKNLNIIHKDSPWYHFSKDIFYYNQNYINKFLEPINDINIYFQGGSSDIIKLNIGNSHSLPIEILDVSYNDTFIFKSEPEKIFLQPHSSEFINYKKINFKIPKNLLWEDSFVSDLIINYQVFGTNRIKNQTVLPWAYFEQNFSETDFMMKEKNYSKFDEFMEINEDTKTIIIKQGYWKLEEDLIIPEGYSVLVNPGTTIDLTNSTLIISYSNLQFLGKQPSPIKIFSSDNTGQGLAVLNVDKISNFQNVEFSNLNAPSKGGWNLTGALTFYDSPINFKNVKISNMNAEDSLDLVRSEYKIENSVFENCYSDCIDDDFSGGIIQSTIFLNCGNDCLDISGAEAEISDVQITNVGDKGISSGEKSNLYLNNIEIDGAYIGVASKDLSNISIEGIFVSNSEYGFAVYQKKPEFGPASIEAFDAEVSSNNEYLVETKSKLLINNKIVLGSKKKVYEELYGVAK